MVVFLYLDMMVLKIIGFIVAWLIGMWILSKFKNNYKN